MDIYSSAASAPDLVTSLEFKVGRACLGERATVRDGCSALHPQHLNLQHSLNLRPSNHIFNIVGVDCAKLISLL